MQAITDTNFLLDEFFIGRITFKQIGKMSSEVQAEMKDKLKQCYQVKQYVPEIQRQKEAAVAKAESVQYNYTSFPDYDLVLPELLETTPYTVRTRDAEMASTLKVPLGTYYDAGDEMVEVSINAKGKFVNVSNEVSFQDLTEEEIITLWPELPGMVQGNEAFQAWYKTMALPDWCGFHEKEQFIEDVATYLDESEICLTRTTVHPIYLLFDDPIQNTINAQQC